MKSSNKYYDFAAVLLIVGMVAGFNFFNEAITVIENLQPHRIIIDTDTAGDDAAALMLAAKAQTVKIEGITVVGGNVSVEQAAKNALMTLEVAGCNVPVYIGSQKFLLPAIKETACIFGKDGMGDNDLIHPTKKAESRDAVDFILDTIRQYPGEIEIIVLGPATNIARAIIKDPLTMCMVKRIWTMGTAGFGHGNATPVAEFNVYKDVLAYKILLDSGIPLTIIGLDNITTQSFFYKRNLETLQKGSESQRFVGMALTGIYDFYSKQNETDAALVPDAIAMAAFLWPDIVEEKFNCRGVAITEKNSCYGQVIFYKEGYSYDTGKKYKEFKHTVITKMDSKKIVEKYINAIK